MRALLLAALVTLAWDGPVPGDPVPPDGYLVQVWAPGAAVANVPLDVGATLTTTLTTPTGSAFVVYAYRRFADALVTISAPSLRIVDAHQPDDPACAPPFGASAISLFSGGWGPTTGRPGSPMQARFSMASASPVTRVVARVDGQDVAEGSGTSITALGFPTPAVGQHSLSIKAFNAAGCEREVLSPIPIVVR